MKIALDIHGVIDTNPEFFADLINTILKDNKLMAAEFLHNEIHVLTGSRLGDGKIKEWLGEESIFYTNIFSIADHLDKMGVPELEKSTPENPFYPEEQWNRVKADYCREHKIDLCIDDNDNYLPHFTTPVARYYSKDKHEEKDSQNNNGNRGL